MSDSKQQAIDPKLQRAIDEMKDPELRRTRRQAEFEAFGIAYAAYRDHRTLTNGHRAAVALNICVPHTGSDPLALTTTLLERLAKEDKDAWVIVLRHALEANVDCNSFDSLKKLFRGAASRLLAANVVIREGKIVLSGPDTTAIWQCLLGRPSTARKTYTFHEENGLTEQIMLVEANEKMAL